MNRCFPVPEDLTDWSPRSTYPLRSNKRQQGFVLNADGSISKVGIENNIPLLEKVPENGLKHLHKVAHLHGLQVMRIETLGRVGYVAKKG